MKNNNALRDGRRLLRFCPLILILLCDGPTAHAQRGAITAPRNLSELVDEAGVILRGQVIAARVEPHPQFSALTTVVVTLRVDETLKGQAGATYTFRQFIWDPRDQQDAAGYAKSGPVLLFLLKPNAQGLSSPVALEQGIFRLKSDASGKLYASNGRNNAGLFNGIATQASAKGIRLTPRAQSVISAPAAAGVAFDDLRDLVKQLMGAS